MEINDEAPDYKLYTATDVGGVTVLLLLRVADGSYVVTSDDGYSVGRILDNLQRTISSLEFSEGTLDLSNIKFIASFSEDKEEL